MKKSRTIIIIALSMIMVAYLIISTQINNEKSKTESVEIDKHFLRTNMTTIEENDVEEVLLVKKFTENESVAIALAKDSHDTPWIYVMWDGQSRYCNEIKLSTKDFENFDNPYITYNLEQTEFGQPYFSLFENPSTDVIVANDKEHDVFEFNCIIDGVQHNLGFYCGLMGNTGDG